MKRKFKVEFSVPPTRKFFYQIPGGPFVETMCSWSEIERAVRTKLAENKLPEIPDLRAEIEDYMCRHLPDGFCTGKSENPPVSYHAVVHATRAIVTGASASRRFGHVTADRIDARASRCLTCPRHSMSLCLSCEGILSDFARYTAGRATPYDKTLRVCRACMGAVPLLLHVDEAAMPVADYDDACWVFKECQDAAKP